MKHDAHCVDCVSRERGAELPGQERRVRRELKASFFFFAAVCFAFGVLLPLLTTGRLTTLWALVGVGSTALMLVVATLYLLTESAVAAWVAMVIELLVGVAVFVVVDGKCLSWPLILMPVVTFFRLRKLRALREELSSRDRSSSPRG